MKTRSTVLCCCLTLLAPSIASSAVTYVNLVDTTLSRSVDGVYLDLNGDAAPLGPVVSDSVANMLTPDYTALGGSDPANAKFEIISLLYTDADLGGSGPDEYADFAVANGIALSDGMTSLARLVAGAPILPTNPNWNGSAIPLETGGGSSWQATSGIAFVGIAFDPTLSFAGDYFYGWVRVNYNDAANTLTILDYAYETTLNTGLTAGQGLPAVPEPTTFTLAGLAAAAFGLFRRKRKGSSAAKSNSEI